MKMKVPAFVVTESFVVTGRGSVLVGLRKSQVAENFRTGDRLELHFSDGRSIECRIRGIESFVGPPDPDPFVGVLLMDDIGRVPVGTKVVKLPQAK
jgi:hypothetical protein